MNGADITAPAIRPVFRYIDTELYEVGDTPLFVSQLLSGLLQLLLLCHHPRSSFFSFVSRVSMTLER